MKPSITAAVAKITAAVVKAAPNAGFRRLTVMGGRFSLALPENESQQDAVFDAIEDATRKLYGTAAPLVNFEARNGLMIFSVNLD